MFKAETNFLTLKKCWRAKQGLFYEVNWREIICFMLFIDVKSSKLNFNAHFRGYLRKDADISSRIE